MWLHDFTVCDVELVLTCFKKLSPMKINDKHSLSVMLQFHFDSSVPTVSLTHLMSKNISISSPHAWRWSLKLQPRAQPGRPRSKTWHTEKHKRQKNSHARSFLRLGMFPTALSPTSLSIHGLPRHVAKQPNSPKITMMAPVPMRTYGALVLSSAAREKKVSKLTFPHTPTASRITPVTWRQQKSESAQESKINRETQGRLLGPVTDTGQDQPAT